MLFADFTDDIVTKGQLIMRLIRKGILKSANHCDKETREHYSYVMDEDEYGMWEGASHSLEFTVKDHFETMEKQGIPGFERPELLGDYADRTIYSLTDEEIKKIGTMTGAGVRNFDMTIDIF